MPLTRPDDETDEALLERAGQLHSEAQALLFEDGLLAAIQSFGPTFVSGSVALDLLVRRDIDIYVQLAGDLDTSAFFEIGAAITRKFQVLKASYSNHFIRNFPGFDHGLFWGIQINHHDRKWKLDLWGYGPGHFTEHCTRFERLREALRAVNPATILRIKDELRDGDGYRYGTSGNDIYTAVLTGNVRTAEQFCDWWRRMTGNLDGTGALLGD